MKAGRDKSIFPIFAAVTVSFLLAIVVSIYSLTMLARENTKEIDMMLTYRIYDTISSSLNEPITVAKTMACDDFLADFLEHEDDMDESEAVAVMQRYLSGLRDGLGYDSAFLVSERSRRYYTYEGLNKIVDPENDEHDVWYSLFIDKRYLFAPEARILLVDDNEMNRKVARNLMKRNGIVPDEAASGAEAIRIMAEKRYDIVLLDHMMPNMDGIETLQRLKGKGLIPEGCVVIALTANAISGARERYIDAGFDDYLSKPIEISQLEKKLAAHLPKSKVAWKETADERAASAPENAREISPESGAAPLGEVFEFEAYSDEEDDILEFIPDESNGGSRNKTDESFDGLAEKLGQIGLDVQSALSFCGDDFEFYLELLSDFAKNCSDKKKELDAHFEGGQWHAFKVEVHALKSTSKTIGAEGLSQKALALEKAAGSMDDEFIRATYPSFAKEYEGLSESISEIVIR